MTYKKTLRHPKGDKAARQTFPQTLQAHRAAQRAIVFVDESGFAHDMPRRYGYAPRGQRCFGRQDGQAKGKINVIGALLNQQLLTACLINTTGDSDVFYAWLTQDLLPKVPQNAVILMDNATFHKRQAIQTAIRQAACTLESAQAKSIRRAQTCSIDDLFSRYSL